MNSVGALSWFHQIQSAFNVLTALHFTDYLFPEDACVTDGATFDFIVVGGGTSGCVIANRLTENEKFNVLLIEAGENPPIEAVEYIIPLALKRTRYDWNFTTQYEKYAPQCHRTSYFNIGRGKMLGGTSSFMVGFYSRGSPDDYNGWAAASNDSIWKPERVYPYFIKSERLEDSAIRNSPDAAYHGFDGLLGVTTTRNVGGRGAYDYLKGFQQLGYDIRTDIYGNKTTGFGYAIVPIADGYRQSSAYSFLKPIKNRKNLFVIKNTMVTKIMFDDNKNAIGVKAYTKCNKTLILKAKKEVIVSAGPVNSPKLLMLSGIGPKKHLKKQGIKVKVDLPVGKNLQDHVATVVFINLDELKEKPAPKNIRIYPFPTAVGHIALNKSQENASFTLLTFHSNNSVDFFKICAFIGFKYNMCDTVYKTGKHKNMLLNVVINMSTKSRGEILLRSTNPEDQPLIYERYFSEKIDLENLAKYTTEVVRVVKTPYFKSLGAEIVHLTPQCDQFKRGTLDYNRCYVTCMIMPMGRLGGTCAMGAVVDGRLRVRGVRRLRVADASVMPEITRSDTFAPTIMIGEKVSDMIKKDHE